MDPEGKTHKIKSADVKLKGGYVFDGFFTQSYHL